MNSWTPIKLSDSIQIKHGYAFPGAQITNNPSENILLTPGNFKIGGGFKGTKYKYFIGDVHEEFILHTGDLIVTMTDLSKETDTLGYSALIPYNPHHRFLHNQRIGLLKINNGKIDKLFLYWVLRTYDYREYIIGSATGTSVQHTSPSRILDYSFLCPSIQEQRAIAAVLSSLDDKIDLLHRQNATLEAMAETLFRQWFVVEEKKEWEEKTIGDVVEIKGGSTPSTKNITYWDGNISWTSPKDLTNKKSIFLSSTERTISASGLAQISSGLLPKGTLLLSSRAPIGYLAITDIELAINQGYIAILNNYHISNYYMYLWCKYNMDEIKAAGNGSVFQEISKSVFRQLHFLLPPEGILSDFNIIITSYFSKIRSNQVQIRTLEKLRDTLLPKLMSGEVRVDY